MAFKLVVVLAFIGITSAYVAPLALIPSNPLIPALNVVQVPQDPLPQYTYTYGVHDSVSGDSKSQIETRNGDKVKGEYSLNDADGYKRTVSYTADSQNGFQAVVDRKPIADVAADIQASIAAQSIAPAAEPLLVKNLVPFNTTFLPIVAPGAAPLAYYSPGLVNAAPLAYSSPPLVLHSAPIAAPLVYNAPLIVNSAPIIASSAPSSSAEILRPNLNVTHYASPLLLPLTHSGPYYYANNFPIA